MICLSEFILNVIIFSFKSKFFELILESATLFEETIYFTFDFHEYEMKCYERADSLKRCRGAISAFAWYLSFT